MDCTERNAAMQAELERQQKEKQAAEDAAKPEGPCNTAAQSQIGQKQQRIEQTRTSSNNMASNAGAQINQRLGMNQPAGQGTQTTSSRFHPLNVTGLSAGDASGKLGVWIAPIVATLDNDFSATAYEGDSFSVLAGVDYKLSDKFLIGVALGYETSDLDTTYNDGTFDSTGFTVAPYLGYAISDNFSVDAIFGYTPLQNDLERSKSTNTVSGSFDSARTLLSANVNYFRLVNQWNISALAGYMYTNESQDSYTETSATGAVNVGDANIYIGELRIGGRAGYFYRQVEPYISAYYLYDSTWNSLADDRDEVEGTVGLNYFPGQAWACGLEVTNSFFRDDFSNTRVLLNVRYDW